MPLYNPQGATVDYAALSTIPGLMLERTGSGAGTTFSAATSPQTVVLPASITLANVLDLELWWSIYSSSDADTLVAALVLDDDSVLTTSGYNSSRIDQTADGTPAVASGETYGAASLSGLAAVSNVAGENINAIARMMRSNDAVSHKPFFVTQNQFLNIDDLFTRFDYRDALTTKRIKGFRLTMTTGTISGSAGIRAMLSA